ncbi:hypothetical protein ABIB25_000446 [Nakamurella sp. UYEF19]|uniref:DUF6191 domain-containing protein n=1 Tax=Nakamurella sp. UYEF19 TaxID=1756392 RepID=UPI00339B6DC6
MGPLGELGALFNPGMRHEIEERQSKANRREEEGNARDGDLRIDLASGVAVINVPGKSGTGAKTDDPEPAGPARQSPTESAADARTASRNAAAQRRAASRTQRKHSAQDSGSSRTNAGDTEQPRTAQVPSSKASRAAR